LLTKRLVTATIAASPFLSFRSFRVFPDPYPFLY
jgi:hypothetical protein